MISKILVPIISAFILSGCVTTIQTLKDHYYNQSYALAAAASLAVYREVKGTEFDDRSDITYVSFPQNDCSAGALDTAPETGALGCRLAVVRPSNGCDDRNDCGQIALSPAVMANLALVDVAKAALANPCAYLIKTPRGERQRGTIELGYSVLDARNKLGCDRRHPPIRTVEISNEIVISRR